MKKLLLMVLVPCMAMQGVSAMSRDTAKKIGVGAVVAGAAYGTYKWYRAHRLQSQYAAAKKAYDDYVVEMKKKNIRLPVFTYEVKPDEVRLWVFPDDKYPEHKKLEELLYARAYADQNLQKG